MASKYDMWLTNAPEGVDSDEHTIECDMCDKGKWLNEDGEWEECDECGGFGYKELEHEPPHCWVCCKCRDCDYRD